MRWAPGLPHRCTKKAQTAHKAGWVWQVNVGRNMQPHRFGRQVCLADAPKGHTAHKAGWVWSVSSETGRSGCAVRQVCLADAPKGRRQLTRPDGCGKGAVGQIINAWLIVDAPDGRRQLTRPGRCGKQEETYSLTDSQPEAKKYVAYRRCTRWTQKAHKAEWVCQVQVARFKLCRG